MLTTHIYLNGRCREAIGLYVKAFGASITTMLPEGAQEGPVIHAEMLIHGQPLMLNDTGNPDGHMSGGYQLSVRFDDEDALKEAYDILKDGSTTISPMQAADYSPCVVRFIDRFDVRLALWVQQHP